MAIELMKEWRMPSDMLAGEQIVAGPFEVGAGADHRRPPNDILD
tara:strand:- start:11812 stop:11943 length:132 start_codon:yes stop_codon:yes gene_type:complete